MAGSKHSLVKNSNNCRDDIFNKEKYDISHKKHIQSLQNVRDLEKKVLNLNTFAQNHHTFQQTNVLSKET